jgi:hypothetical protein
MNQVIVWFISVNGGRYGVNNMTAINTYLNGLTKCKNQDCTVKISCLRYSITAPGRYKIRNNKCDYYFKEVETGDAAIKQLKDMFGMK